MAKTLDIMICSYNSADYLIDLLNNLAGQMTNELENEIDITVIDDGSTDDTEDVMDKFAEYPNIIHHKKNNTGIASSRNIALNMAKAKYMWFLDADDLLSENSLSDVLGFLKESKPDMLRVGYSNDVDDLSHVKLEVIPDPDLLQNFLAGKFKAYAWQFIFLTEKVQNHIEYPDNWNYEDLAVIFDLLSLFKDSDKTYYSPSPIYRYRLRATSISRVPSQHSVDSLLYISNHLRKSETKEDEEFAFIVNAVGAQLAYDANDRAHYEYFKQRVPLKFFNSKERIFQVNYWGKYIVVKSPWVRNMVLKAKKQLGKGE